jgi:hypothetical protein
MQTLKQHLKDLNSLITQDKELEAFEKHYSENVVMQENENAPTIGKAENRKRLQEFMDNIVEFRKAIVSDVAIGDNLTMTTWHFDYTHKQWGVRNYKQVSVQKWKEGKIYHEQFFYGS